MSESEVATTSGLNSQLAPEQFEIATLMDEAHTLRKRLKVVDTMIPQLEEELNARNAVDLESIIEVEGMDHDEFLREYQGYLLNISQESPLVKQFERALKLRNKLTPGEFLQLSSGKVVTIATPDDDSDPNNGIRPRVKRTIPSTSSQYQGEAALVWNVPTEEYKDPVSVDESTVISLPLILFRLNRQWFGLNNTIIISDAPEAVSSFEKLGQSSKAENLKETILTKIVEYFNEEVFSDSHESEESIKERISALRLLDKSVYDTLINQAKMYASQGKFINNMRLVAELDFSESEQPDATENETMPIKHYTPVEFAKIYANFAEEGEALIIARKNNPAEE